MCLTQMRFHRLFSSICLVTLRTPCTIRWLTVHQKDMPLAIRFVLWEFFLANGAKIGSAFKFDVILNT